MNFTVKIKNYRDITESAYRVLEKRGFCRSDIVDSLLHLEINNIYNRLSSDDKIAVLISTPGFRDWLKKTVKEYGFNDVN